MKLLLIAVLAITGCKKQSDESSAAAPPGPLPDDPRDPWLHPRAEVAPQPPPVAVPPSMPKERPLPTSKPDATVEQLLADLRPMLASEYGAVITHVAAKYVRRDGTLDPKFGELVINTATPNEDSVDPDRPIGAPVPKRNAESADCPEIRFAGGTWSKRTYLRCHDDNPVSTRCSVAQIWERAIERTKAPPTALAVIERYQSPDAWFFTVEDNPRKIHIRTNFPDDCTP